MKIVNSWKPITIFAKSSIVEVRLGSEYTSAVWMIQNKTKFEDTKKHFVSEGLLNISKLYIFSLNTTGSSGKIYVGFLVCQTSGTSDKLD